MASSININNSIARSSQQSVFSESPLAPLLTTSPTSVTPSTSTSRTWLPLTATIKNVPKTVSLVMLNFLGTQEIATIAITSRQKSEESRDAIVDRARHYGYERRDKAGAREYIRTTKNR